ncbi:MAG: hypothetical protein IT267_01235 [Saprospiraceae bacterium]|nr:hypothetical protein [Saprospiraceae bacterium]
MKSLYCSLLALVLTQINSSLAQSWQRLNGPIGTEIPASLITRDKGEIYCFSSRDQLFLSKNLGQTWTTISLASILGTIQYVKNLKESPSGEIFLSTNNRLYKLDKQTNNWYMFPHTFTAFDFDFLPNGNSIYVASKDGMYISTNSKTFTKVQSWSEGSVEILCLGGDNNFVRRVSGTDATLWRFADSNGKFLHYKNSKCCRSLFFHRKSNTIFDYNKDEILTSIDFGATWNKLSLSNNLNFAKLIELSDGRILGIGSQIFESTDNGVTWNISQEYNYKYTSTYVYNLAISKSNKDELVLLDNNAAVLIQRNNATQYLDLPLSDLRISNLVQFGQDNIFCSTSVYSQISFDDGINWKKILDRDYSEILFWKDGSVAYKLMKEIILSTDELKSYSKKTLPAYTIGKMILDKDENIILLDQDKVFKSTDKGTTWQLLGQNLHNPIQSPYDKVIINERNIIMIKTYPASEYYYSDDLGLSWTKFFPQGITTHSNIYLTKDNIFIWETSDSSNYIIRYTSDFFNTYNDLKIDSSRYLLNADKYGNLFLIGYPKNHLLIKNIITNQQIKIPFTGFTKLNLETFNIYRGENNYLYASYFGNPVYKFTQALPTDESIIQGTVFIDEDLDCLRSVTETKTNPFELKAVGSGFVYSTIVDSNGNFKVFVGPDTYSLDVNYRSPVWKECNFPKNINIQAQQIINQNNLLVQLTEKCADLNTQIILGRLRRCFNNNKAYVRIKNDGTKPSFNTQITVKLDPLFDNIISSQQPANINGNNFSYMITEILPGDEFVIEYNFDVSCNSRLSQEHCVSSVIANNEECKTYANPTISSSSCGKNFGSWDPNYKDVMINGNSTETFTSSDKQLEYVIHFQNTGTDTAYDIYILDKLDTRLVWSTFKPLQASHSYTYSINSSGLLKIKFNNIYLPDSNTHEANSHGFFKFSIEPSKSLEPGEAIHNFADIYFDKNLPERTNVAVVKLKILTKNIDIYSNALLNSIPNPAKEQVLIELPEAFKNKLLRIVMSSMDSKRIREFSSNAEWLIVHKDDLLPGIYFVSINSDDGDFAYCKIIFE